jgi:hypothetical protein
MITFIPDYTGIYGIYIKNPLPENISPRYNFIKI